MHPLHWGVVTSPTNRDQSYLRHFKNTEASYLRHKSSVPVISPTLSKCRKYDVSNFWVSEIWRIRFLSVGDMAGLDFQSVGEVTAFQKWRAAIYPKTQTNKLMFVHFSELKGSTILLTPKCSWPFSRISYSFTFYLIVYFFLLSLIYPLLAFIVYEVASNLIP